MADTADAAADAAAAAPAPEPKQAATPEAVLKPEQRLSTTHRLAAGIALCLLGLCAWSYRQQRPRGQLFGAPLKPSELATFEALGEAQNLDLGDLPQGPESLEDALSSLEAGEAWASEAVKLPERGAAKARAQKPKQVQGAPKQPAEEPEAVFETPAVASTKAKAKALVSGFFDSLAAPRPEPPRAPAAPKRRKNNKAAAQAQKSDEVAEALEKLEGKVKAGGKRGGKKQKKAAEADEADQEKAQSIIRDYMDKLMASPPPEEEKDMDSNTLKERLQALIAEDPEKDQDPDVRKAKEIIKDTIKKLDLNKEDAGKGKASKAEDEVDADADPSHLEFARRLKEEEAKRPDQDLGSVKQEFKREYAGDARRLLCSGCKLVAGRLDSELSNHDVHDADSPAEMLANKRRAIDATCRTMRHLHVTAGEGGPSFQATEVAEEGEGAAPRLGQRLCSALLEEAKFDILSALIRRKVPSGSLFHAPEEVHENHNWERMLCAQRARLCKRSEVREDDEGDEL